MAEYCSSSASLLAKPSPLKWISRRRLRMRSDRAKREKIATAPTAPSHPTCTAASGTAFSPRRALKPPTDQPGPGTKKVTKNVRKFSVPFNTLGEESSKGENALERGREGMRRAGRLVSYIPGAYRTNLWPSFLPNARMQVNLRTASGPWPIFGPKMGGNPTAAGVSVKRTFGACVGASIGQVGCSTIGNPDSCARSRKLLASKSQGWARNGGSGVEVC